MAKRVTRAGARTAEQLERDQAVHERFSRERPTLERLIASGEFLDPHATEVPADSVGAFLKLMRLKSQVTLDQMERKTNIDKSTLSRLENGLTENPTVATIRRYAGALGKEFTFSFRDQKPKK
ncbi:MAG: helix-turn-helix transcriptional regulator [Planctomycetaceae bacterium]|nr:helix-turn-helix transcriptional regulator [Planctomycetaceae bacterium]